VKVDADTIPGTLTIGQAPRPDVTPILDRYARTSVKRTHLGLLDLAGTHAAKAGEVVLVTRFSDRSSVRPNETGDMLLGMSLDQVTACVTINAATIWSAVYDPEPT